MMLWCIPIILSENQGWMGSNCSSVRSLVLLSLSETSDTGGLPGTFESGEARLLFSSAQVEYIQYWLHAVKLTKEPIPIPDEDYMISQGQMLSCSPVIYRDAATLKKAIKVRYSQYSFSLRYFCSCSFLHNSRRRHIITRTCDRL